MKLKIFKFLLLFILTTFTSCNFATVDYWINGSIRRKVIENKEKNWEKIVFFTPDASIQGFDLDTLQQKIYVKTNHDLSKPYMYNDYLFVGDQGNAYDWGSGVVILDKKFSIVKELDTLPNILTFIGYGNKLFVTTMCFYNGKGGMTVINLDDFTIQENYTKLPGIQSNQYFNCGYKDKIYMATDYNANSANLLTEFNAEDFSVIKVTEEFHSSFPRERCITVINNNQMWISAFFSGFIEIYDLDTDKLIKSIDMRKYGFNPETDALYRSCIYGNKYIIALENRTEKNNHKLFIFNTEDFELYNLFDFPINPVMFTEEFKYFDSHPNNLYFCDDTFVYKYSLENGEIEIKTEVAK